MCVVVVSSIFHLFVSSVFSCTRPSSQSKRVKRILELGFLGFCILSKCFGAIESAQSQERKQTKKVWLNMSDEVVLQSADEKDFRVPREVASMSVTIANMLQSKMLFRAIPAFLFCLYTIFNPQFIKGISDSIDGTGAPIPLPNLNGAVLEKIIEYCTYHKETPVPPRAEDDYSVDNISEWDLKFIAVDVPFLFDIVLVGESLLSIYLFM